MKGLISLLIGIFATFSALAQQEPVFTQYYIDGMSVNPAISGTKEFSLFTLQTRKQWLGFEGSPFTTSIAYHGSLNTRSALGVNFLFDKSDPTTQGDFQLNYAYRIPLNYDNMYLSFGIGAKLMYHNLDFSPDDIPPGEDNAFSANSYEKIFGDASSGVYLYANNFYFGFSSSNLLESSFNTPVYGSPHPNSRIRQYYYLGGYRFHVNNKDWQVEPSFLFRTPKGFNTISDLTMRVLYLEDTWLGLTYRTDQTGIFAFGFRSGSIHFSYSYDHTFAGNIQKYTYGTHEIGVAFRIQNMSKIRHIRSW